MNFTTGIQNNERFQTPLAAVLVLLAALLLAHVYMSVQGHVKPLNSRLVLAAG